MANVQIFLNVPSLGDSIAVGGDQLIVDVDDDGMLVVNNYINPEGENCQIFLPKGSWTACVAVKDNDKR